MIKKQFISLFKQRLKDNHTQEWNSSINEICRLQCYSKFKNVFEVEKYLSVIDIRKYRVTLTKFRCSNHSLNVMHYYIHIPPCDAVTWPLHHL